jgi:CHRD domain-containing protein
MRKAEHHLAVKADLGAVTSVVKVYYMYGCGYFLTELMFMASLLLFVLATAILLYQSIYSPQVVHAVDQLDRYWVVLSGDQQTPTVDTNAIGFVGLKFQDDTSRLIYNVNLDNIQNVTGIYLYHREDGHNRTEVLDFMKETKESNKEFHEVLNITKEGNVTGTISYGGVTKNDLGGYLKGKSLSDLRDAMTGGKMYIDVTTRNYPDGEIGGNIFIPIDRVFPDLNEFRWS